MLHMSLDIARLPHMDAILPFPFPTITPGVLVGAPPLRGSRFRVSARLYA